MLTVVAAASGLGLVFFYQPESSASSLIDLEQASDFGFLRDVHYWAAQGLLLAAWLHLARIFAAGSYRRRLGWRVTVALVVLVTLEAWLGDQLTEPQASRAAFGAHVLIVPLLFAGFVGLWQRRRRAAVPDAPAEIVDRVAKPDTTARDEPAPSSEDAAQKPKPNEQEPNEQEPQEKPEAER